MIINIRRQKINFRLLFSILFLIAIFLIGGFLIAKTEKASNVLGFVGGIGRVELQPLKLSKEDISNLTKPAVVRIYNYIKGKAIIPAFDINWDTIDIIYLNEEPLEYPVEKYTTGSGFIINQDGYILTNAHVVSNYVIKDSLAKGLIGLKFLRALRSEEDLKKIENLVKRKGIDPADAEQFGQELALNLAEKLAKKITLLAPEKITILDPSSSGDKLSELINKGFPAKIISVNENFLKDEKDIALLKIEATNLPAINLGDSNTVKEGNGIYVYGFPKTGQFNAKDILEPSFTQGIINGLKDSRNKLFKIFQTDAKISTGSSGGPLLNDKGEVIGLITFATIDPDAGDTFAFAIPINLAKEIINAQNINIEENNYTKFFKSALLYFQNNRCQKAIQDFNIVGQLNNRFNISRYVQPYIDKCSALISSGQSIDTRFDEFKVWLKNIGSLFWFLFAAAILTVLAAGFFIVRLSKKIKRKEQEMHQLEDVIIKQHYSQVFENDDSQSIKPEPVNPESVNEPVNPDLLNYVQSTRNLGLSDEEIANELRKVGWPENEIQKILKQ